MDRQIIKIPFSRIRRARLRLLVNFFAQKFVQRRQNDYILNSFRQNKKNINPTRRSPKTLLGQVLD